MDWTFSLYGFFVGILVGLTGIGGAALMTPFLILFGGIRPVVAVGTDLAYGALTKAFGSFVHYRQGTVDLTVSWHLGAGSVPAALLGVGLIGWMKGQPQNGAVDPFITRALGLALIVVALSLLVRPWARQSMSKPFPSMYSKKRRSVTVLVGAIVGFLVGLTSVGSGSLIAASLLTIYPELPGRRVVGTDIFHGMCLTSAAALAHLGLGTIDPSLLAALLAGSIPGVWLGSRLAVAVPDRVLRPALATVLLAVGYKLV